DEVSADLGASTPASSSVRWQWQRVPDGLTAWSDVPGATGTTASVVPLSGDGLVPGWFYRLAVTYAKDGYPDATAYSNVVGPSLGLLDFLVATSPSSTAAAPVRAGDEVTATVSDASVDGIDAAFQWSADGVAIPGATRSTFTPGDDQVGAKLTVAVTGSKDGYLARTVSATAAAVVGAAGRTCAEPFSLVGRVCTVRLDYTGQQGEITLPEDADLVTVDLAGASGGVLKDFPTSLPGRGGRLRGDLRGAAGQRLVYLVGQVGDLTAGTRTVGGGGASASTSSFYTRGGGGTFLASAATDVLLAVAGGGGGVRPNTAGGSGSGSSTAGSAAPVATIGSSCSGEGATATSGGYRPECLTPNNGGTGPAAVEAGVILPGPGGFGGREMNSFTVGGGGGGGYWGGGGGASHAGGGGSGYSGGLSGSIATEASLGGNTGHGYVVLTYTPAVAPDAPTGVRAVAGDGSATVSWTPPAADGGAAVRGYTVTGSPAGSCVTTGATSCVVTGLENGRAHTFTVRASNLRGAGPASAPSAPVTPRVPAAAPVISLQPVGVLAMDGRSASFSVGFTGAPTPSVGWEVSADGGATWAPVSTADGFTISTSTLMSRLSVTAGAVLHRSRYRAVVTNEGGAVTSDAVGLSVSRLLRAPAGFKATPGDGRVRLSWSESVGNKPLPVSGYVVQLLDPSGDETVCLVPASASLSCEVAGLVNARTYSFSVVAVNAAGAGRVATTRGTPFAPVSFTRAPEPVTVRAGEVFTLSAAVAADPVPSLRWEVSADGGRTWRNAGGAVTGTTTSYSEKAQAARSGWRYRVKASQRVGGVSYSGAVVVTITR
ncbi:fibronectin type III domain-containing protein, partial [Nocardioides sp.]|uniref:fibronectin type III domain-containing protein n=1 Tax=Nocardioides sp. TaxID=35761 RepID=UPI0035160461